MTTAAPTERNLREENRRLRKRVKDLRESLELAYEWALDAGPRATRETYAALTGEWL